MRRSPLHRLGAAGLLLLLQAFVLSGFVHACCFDSSMADGHGGQGEMVEASMAHHAHGAADEASAMAHHHHGADTPPQGGDDPVHEHASNAPFGSNSGHGGHGHESSLDGCGYCCEFTPGSFVVTDPGSGTEALTPELTLRVARAVHVVLPTAPDFLLPWSTAPPPSHSA